MNLLKKILTASISAIALFATVTAMASAAELKMTATPAEDKTYVDLTMSHSGAEEKIMGAGATIAIDTALFEALDLTFDEDNYDTFLAQVQGEEGPTGFSTDLTESRASNTTLQYSNGELKYVFTSGTSTTAKNTLPTDQENIFTVRLTVKDGANSSVWTDGYKFTMSGCTLSTTTGVDYKQNNSTLTVTPAVITGTGSDDDTATITQVGEVFTGENDADDKAVAYTLNIANASGNTVSATSTWTKADSTTETRTLSKAIENIEATNVVLGIIVQFDGDDYSNVEITNMSIN